MFNSARKRDSPLSRKLRSILDKSGLRSQVSQIPDLDQLDVFEKDLPAALDKLRPEPPKLGDPRPASVREHGGAWVPMDDSPHMQPSTRYFIAVQIEGDHQLLTCWPDATDEDLDPVDAEVQEESKDWPESWGSVERDRLKAAEETWQLSTANFPGEDEVWALYTFFDLTPDQEASAGAGGSIDLQAQFYERREVAVRIVNQIAIQTARFFDEEVPQLFKDLIEGRRRTLTHRAAVLKTLRFPNEWVLPVPQLETKPAATEASPVQDIGLSSHSSGAPTEIRVDMRARLAPASFEDVQRVIRVWADALERHPAAYHDLDEDRVSDLLAATLNATLPGANREVYSRGGKSDIFIKADTLAEGLGPAKVFICESKWARSNKWVQDAVDPQLFGYLTAHDTSAVLLLLMDQKNFKRTVEARHDALRAIPGHVSEQMGTSDWPIFSYENEGRRVDLCVATVHLPKKLASKATPSA